MNYSTPTNSTGWTELFNGHPVDAVYKLYDISLAGYSVVILFFVFQFMLYIKTRNLLLTWVTGLFFASMFASTFILKPIALQITYVMIVIELGGIIYLTFWRQ